MRRYTILSTFSMTLVITASLFGCGPSVVQRPIAQAPPISQPMPAPNAPNAPGGAVYQWQDVPAGQQVPVTRAVFDQGGYQIFAATGETIVVPFVNQNLYALKFGRTSGSQYFVNEGGAPTLYLAPNGFLENAAAQNARWYPFPADYRYERPVYVSLAPSWSSYVGMGWYPGMHYYGGMWGYSPYAHFAWMPGFYVNIGGSRYNSFNSYHSYYTTHRNYVTNRAVYKNYSTRSTGSFGSANRSSGSFGSANRSTGSFGNSNRSTGTFGSGRSSGTGSFGSGRSAGTGSFGSGRSIPSSGGSTGSLGSGRSGSFGGSSSGFSSTPRSGGSSFGGTRSTGSGGSFGGGRSSSSGSSFGGGRSSSSSSGGRRR